jgi:hypothetical protein
MTNNGSPADPIVDQAIFNRWMAVSSFLGRDGEIPEIDARLYSDEAKASIEGALVIVTKRLLRAVLAHEAEGNTIDANALVFSALRTGVDIGVCLGCGVPEVMIGDR